MKTSRNVFGAAAFAREQLLLLRHRLLALGVCSALFLFSTSGCSVRKYALTKLADALAQSAGTLASDEDPDLIKEAAPFSLKLMESVLAELPRHEQLLESAASGFAQYAYAFVQQEADELEDRDLAAASALRKRAVRLYLRARNHGLRGLEAKHRNFARALNGDAKGALRGASKEDVPLLYWTAVSWASAISLSKDNPGLVAELPRVEALMDRALELDERYAQGAIHSFLIAYEMSRPSGQGSAEARSRRHFERAWELCQGRQAAPLVALAEAVTIQKQDVKEFEALLKRALAIDADKSPKHRLANLILQRRARWLLSRKEELFLITEEETR